MSKKVQKIIKRLFDFLGALVGLIISAPLLIVTAILIKLDSSGPVLFRQERVGEKGRIFTIYKLRTMTNDFKTPDPSVDEIRRMEAIGQDSRITEVGRLLRKFGVDELPQLVNILRGEMSFVGPRPYFLPRIEINKAFLGDRTLVKPGLTSLVVVRGGIRLSEDEILKCDLEYIRSQNFWLDLKILLKTISLVLLRKV